MDDTYQTAKTLLRMGDLMKLMCVMLYGFLFNLNSFIGENLKKNGDMKRKKCYLFVEMMI